MRKIRKGKVTRSRSCEGKVQHDTAEEAQAHAEHLGAALEIYFCKFCGYWHMGHGRK